MQAAMMRAHEVHGLYRPRRAAYSTWVTRCVNFRLLDLARQRGRQAARDDQARETERERVAGADDANPLEALVRLDPSVDLAEWLGRVRDFAVAVFSKKVRRRGRHWFAAHQVATVAILMEALNLSARGAAGYLKGRPDLCLVLRLRHVPHFVWFHRARKYATENLGLRLGRVRAARPRLGAGSPPDAR